MKQEQQIKILANKQQEWHQQHFFNYQQKMQVQLEGNANIEYLGSRIWDLGSGIMRTCEASEPSTSDADFLVAESAAGSTSEGMRFSLTAGPYLPPGLRMLKEQRECKEHQ